MLSDAHFLAVAHIVADAGTCSRLKVGAVLVYARRIISTGYNGAPAGMLHCQHDEYSDIIQEPAEGYSTHTEKGCTTAVHAEVNAIAFAAKHGVSTDGSVLYTTDSPCVACAQLIINAGVKEVRYGRRYRDPSGINLLERAGIRTQELGEPGLRLVQVVSGNRQGMHSSKSSDPAFDEGWNELAARRSRRGPGF